MIELSLAPMLKVTTPEFRLLMSILSPNVTLFTEMIVASTVLHAGKQKISKILGCPDSTTVVQIGGSSPDDIASSVSILMEYGWQRFNLNCGCPSSRVQSGCFGAVLMLDHTNVANIINAVFQRTGVVLSLKIRTGVDDQDSFDFFSDFLKYISDNSPCRIFYIHARKCWLSGLSPKHNRNIPPLMYQYVYDSKKLFPDLSIHLNGGIQGVNGNHCSEYAALDGIMIGRHAVTNINIFNEYMGRSVDMGAVIKEYFDRAIALQYPKTRVLLPLNNLRKGKPQNKAFRLLLNEMLHNEMELDQVYTSIEPFLD